MSKQAEFIPYLEEELRTYTIGGYFHVPGYETFSDTDISTICSFIRDNNEIIGVNFSNLSLSFFHLNQVLSVLAGKNNLESLNFSGTNLGNPFHAGGLAQIFRQNKEIKVLTLNECNLSNNTLIFNALAEAKNLEYLHIASNNITDELLNNLLLKLESFELSTLNLANNQLQFANVTVPQISILGLNIAGNPILENNYGHVGSFVNIAQVQKLVIGGQNFLIKAESITEFFDHTKSSKLDHLIYSLDQKDNKYFGLLCKSLVNKTNILSLSVENIINLNLDSIELLSKSKVNVKTLHLEFAIDPFMDEFLKILEDISQNKHIECIQTNFGVENMHNKIFVAKYLNDHFKAYNKELELICNEEVISKDIHEEGFTEIVQIINNDLNENIINQKGILTSTSEFKYICDMMNEQIRLIDFTDSNLNSFQLLKLSSFVPFLANLEQLSIMGNNLSALTQQQLDNFFFNISQSKSLASLSFSLDGCSSVSSFFPKIPNVDFLDVNGINNVAMFEKLLDKVIYMKNLHFVCFNFTPEYTYSLNFEEELFNSKCIKMLFAIIKNNPELMIINVPQINEKLIGEEIYSAIQQVSEKITIAGSCYSFTREMQYIVKASYNLNDDGKHDIKYIQIALKALIESNYHFKVHLEDFASMTMQSGHNKRTYDNDLLKVFHNTQVSYEEKLNIQNAAKEVLKEFSKVENPKIEEKAIKKYKS